MVKIWISSCFLILTSLHRNILKYRLCAIKYTGNMWVWSLNFGNQQKCCPICSLFWEEIGACAAVYTGDVVFCLLCLLLHMMKTLFMLVMLASQWTQTLSNLITQNRRSLPVFEGGKNPILKCFCLIMSFLTHFYLWCKLHLNQIILFAFKTFFKETRRCLP